MSIFDRKPVLRWLTPLAFVLVVGGGGLVAATATADPRLPSRSAAELLVDLQSAKIDALSGTIVQRSDLGIPNIPGMGGTDSASLTSLISGTHTLQVWYSGPDKARLAVQGTFDESDVIVNGSDTWTWSYKDKAATHRVLSGKHGDKAMPSKPTDLPKTPQEAADKVLAAIDPTTTVTTDGTANVAGRSAYELVLSPKDDKTLVRQVKIAIDGAKHIPLSVQVIAGTDSQPTTVFEVAFTKIDFSRPDDAQFAFKAPRGTKVTEATPGPEKTRSDKASGSGKSPDGKTAKGVTPSAADQPKVVGTGWSTVVVAKVPSSSTQPSPGDKSAQPDMSQVLNSLPKVSGTWGSGRLLSGKAFSLVITDDGRMAAGSVHPEELYKALAK